MPTLLQQARFALGELGIRPHKRLGQHFLIDPRAITRMIEAAHINSRTTLLEIGPGLGALSDTLATFAARLYLVEKDAVLANHLRERFTGVNSVQVVTADFLELDLSATCPEPEIHVIASLPYNVATPILFRLLERRHTFPAATVMVQKEVGERLSAAPGTKSYGALSILIQMYAEVTSVCAVEPRSFFPAPQVRSQIVRLVFYKEPRVTVYNEQSFRRVVKAAFAQRRKTLRNALRAAGYRDLERIEIDLQRRGETLSLEEFAALAGVLAGQNQG